MSEPTLEQIFLQLNEWRKNRKSRRVPIPQSFWDHAISFAKKSSVGIVAKELSLDHGKLKKMVEAGTDKSNFYQMPAQSRNNSTTFEFEDPNGSKFKISGENIDMISLISQFWV